MEPNSIVLGIPSTIMNLEQQGLIERAFHDGLYPNLAFRAEAMPEEWPANTGVEQFQTRPGLLKPRTKPIKPGTEPVGQSVNYEQWVARLEQYADSIDTHIPTSVTASANLFLRNIKQLGLQAGQSVNRIARNSMFQAYLQGQTVLIQTCTSGSTQIRVASLNGFTEVVVPGSSVRPQPVSPNYPLPIKIGSGSSTVSNTVIAANPDDGEDPIGPGTLTLGTAYSGTTIALRSTVKSIYAPRVVRSAPGDSVDCIGPGDGLTLQMCINATAYLRRANVQPHDDGFYHAHVSALGNAQFFSDPVLQRLNQSLPEYVVYKEGFLGQVAGILFFLNNEAPEYGMNNVGNTIATANDGIYSDEMGAEVVNGSGVQIGRILMTGKGGVYERYLDESQYVTEAGTLGKIGEFNVTNNGLQVLTERVRLIIRAPMDKLQQTVTTSWSITTSFPAPTDITAPSGPEVTKRMCVLEFAT